MSLRRSYEEEKEGKHAEQGVKPGSDPHLHRGHLLLLPHAQVVDMINNQTLG